MVELRGWLIGIFMMLTVVNVLVQTLPRDHCHPRSPYCDPFVNPIKTREVRSFTFNISPQIPSTPP